MGWSAYASALGTGQRLTGPMRSELFAALTERNAALAAPLTLDAAANATIMASGWESDLVSVNGALVTWSSAVALVAGGYVDPALNGSATWGGLPTPFAGVDPALIGSKWNVGGYWNAVRAAIVGLTTVRYDLLANGDVQTYTKTGMGGPYATEALAAGALSGASETNASSGNTGCGIFAFNPTNISRKFTQCFRNNATVDLPSGGITILVTLFGGAGNNCAPNLFWGIGSGSPLNIPFPAASAYVGHAMGVTGGGGAGWELHYPGYNNSTVAAADFASFAPTGGDHIGDYQAQASVYMAGGNGTAVGVQPTFSFV